LSNKKNVNLVHLTPILVSLLFGLVCAFLILMSPVEIYQITPFPEDVSGSFSNALYFVILVAISASLLYLLLKRKNHKVVTSITVLALTTSFFMLSMVYLSAILSFISNSELLVLILSVLCCHLLGRSVRNILGSFYSNFECFVDPQLLGSL